MTEPRPCPGHECASTLRESEFLCKRCVHRAERILGDLVAETRELEITITRQARISSTGHRKRGDEQPLPVNLKAAHDGDNALMLLFEWADFIAQRHGEKGMPIRTTGVDKRVEFVNQAVGIILRHVNWLATDEQGPECASAVWHVRRNLRRITDRPVERLLAGPCHALMQADVTETGGTITIELADSKHAPKCQLSLYRIWGADTITCDGYGDPEQAHLPPAQRRGCGAVHLSSDRATWLRESVAEQWLPLRLVWESLYVLVPDCVVSWDTARQWPKVVEKRTKDLKTGKVKITRTPPQLPAYGKDVKLYLGRDILRLAERPARTGRKRTRHRGKVAS